MRFPARTSRARIRGVLAALCFCVMVSGGCAERNDVKARVKSFPWAATSRKHARSCRNLRTPRTRKPRLHLSSLSKSSRRLLRWCLPTSSPRGLVFRLRPRLRDNSARFEPPTIVPQLTPQETEAAQQQTKPSLSIAERNVIATRGRTLNAAQSDLVSKVRSFVSEAREAAHNGDWTRASNAAKKAQVLSEELARSL